MGGTIRPIFKRKERKITSANFNSQTIWTGDNLDIMRGMNSDSVDLIYLDPPFNSKANYAAPIGSKAAGAAFKDTWGLDDVKLVWHGEIKHAYPGLYALLTTTREIHGASMMSYLIYMSIRVMEMRRLLKPKGSIYLHCDPTANSYLRLLMDAVFGAKAFQNEIVWKRVTSTASSKARSRRYPTDHDTVLAYGDPSSFVMQYRPYDPEYVRRNYKHDDGDGRGPYTLSELAAATPERIAELEADGRLVRRPNAKSHRYKNYLADKKGVPVNDIWDDVAPLSSGTAERTGYPTQKPLALLHRIIKGSSNEGDMVLDPFCGCATTCIAAEQLQRNWVGIDISEKAADLVQSRLREELGLAYQGAHRTDIPKRTDLGKIPKYNCAENRRYLYGQQGGYCTACGTHFEPRHFQVDHIIPRANGGNDHISNLQLLCGSCNAHKGTKSHEELIKLLTDKGWIKRRQEIIARSNQGPPNG